MSDNVGEAEFYRAPTRRERFRLSLAYGATVWRRQGVKALARRFWRKGQRLLTGRDYTYEILLDSVEPDRAALARQRREVRALAATPLFSLLTPLSGHETPADIRACAQSLQAQTYPHWEWCVVGLGDRTNSEAWRVLQALAQTEPRLRLATMDGTSEAARARTALQAADEWVSVLNAANRLAPNALYEAACASLRTPETDIFYFDEDVWLNTENRRAHPWLKPRTYSPELLLSINYLQHAFTRRVCLPADFPAVSEMEREAAWEWEWAFRSAEAARHIAHLPFILTHIAGETARPLPRSEAERAAQAACVAAHLKRTGIANPRAEWTERGVLRAVWPTDPTTISVIIPTKENAPVLRRCLDSVRRQTLPEKTGWEIVLVDNGSVEPETLALYAELRADTRVRIVNYDAPFNYSQACNLGASHATGALLLFLNNDTEFLTDDGLEELIRWAQQPAIGAAGAKLLYPDGDIQHAGVIVGLMLLVAHVFYKVPETFESAYGGTDWYRNFMAVTGACVMLRREIFEEIGGYDEAYRLVFSDVTLCLHAVEHGYRVVYTPFARLTHFEGKTRANSVPQEDNARAMDDFAALAAQGDPYFNGLLSTASQNPVLLIPSDETMAARLERYRETVLDPLTPRPPLPQGERGRNQV